MTKITIAAMGVVMVAAIEVAVVPTYYAPTIHL